MPSSSVHKFTEAADYAARIRAGHIDMMAIGRGAFHAKLVQIDLHSLWMQRFSETLPRIARAATSPARAIILFPPSPRSHHVWGGREIAWGTLYRVGIGQETFQRCSELAETASMSLPIESFAATVAAITHREIKSQSDGLTIRPPSEAMARLQRLHAAAGALAESAPAILANPETARSLEQELVLAMVTCAAEPAEEDSLALRHHQAILRGFRALIEANVGRPLYLPEICAALGVSNRTLQRCCLEQLGVSPLRYLMLRRMHMVRRALAAAFPAPGVVTATATQYGFWELGRFSVTYRHVFGEPPSATLNRQPGPTRSALTQFA